MTVIQKMARAGMSILNRFSGAPLQKRSFREAASVGGSQSDWIMNGVGIDAELWQNIYALRQRSRDLFRTNSYMKKFASELKTNVFGSNGINLRMRIKETEDRPITNAKERAFLREDEEKSARLLRSAIASQEKKGIPALQSQTRNLEACEERAQAFANTSKPARVKKGDPDRYANQIIQDAWKEWQRKETATMAGKLTYAESRSVRLISCARDGDCFIRLIRDPKVNKFGFSIQIINSEWCDHNFNTVLQNGNEVRMGIEFDKWKRPVAYHFVHRQPGDWQFSIPGAFAFTNASLYERVPAREIIHYARLDDDADQSRGVPWIVSEIAKLRHLDKYEEAEVIAARAEACKGGHYTSDKVPDGGYTFDPVDPTDGKITENLEPGEWKPLPWGIHAEAHNPTHPSGNFGGFLKANLRGIGAGINCSYPVLANDLEGANFSSMRGGLLNEREGWKLLQQFDIDIAELPIFEPWLEMSLITGAIPLPLEKLEKFNAPHCQGRRWDWVDPLKDANADTIMVQQYFSSRTRIAEENGADFMEILEEQAAEKMMMEELGLAMPVVAGAPQAAPEDDAPTKPNNSKP